MGPSWDQFVACWSKVGPKLDPSGSQLGDLLAKGDLGQYAKCANYRNCMQFVAASSVRKCTPPQLELYPWTEGCSNRTDPFLNYHASAPLVRADFDSLETTTLLLKALETQSSPRTEADLRASVGTVTSRCSSVTRAKDKFLGAKELTTMAMSSAMIAEQTMGQSVTSSWWLLPDPTVTLSEPHHDYWLGGAFLAGGGWMDNWQLTVWLCIEIQEWKNHPTYASLQETSMPGVFEG